MEDSSVEYEPQLTYRGADNTSIQDDRFNYLCRTCLSLHTQVSSLFSQCEDFFVNDMIMSLCSVEIQEGDGLPNKICLSCFDDLRAAYSFKMRCENADKRLKEGVSCLFDNSDRHINNTDPMKSEVSNVSPNYHKEIDPLLNNSANGNNVVFIKREREPSPINQKLYESFMDHNSVLSTSDNHFQNTIKEENDILQEMRMNQSNKKINKTLKRLKQSSKMTTGCKLLIPPELKSSIFMTGDKKSVVCAFCNFTCSRTGTMKTHLSSHSDKKPYRCTMCDYNCSNCSNFKRHMTVHTKIKSYSCTVCTYTCSRIGYLREHEKVHRSDRPFLCDQCHYTAKSQTALRVHKINKHSTEKRFICDDCGATFKTKSNLLNHIMVHMGIKNFACDLCPYKSIKLAAFENHRMMVHTKERPFACDQCPYRCITRGYLKIHKRTHLTIKMFTCDQCMYTCHTKSRLKAHSMIHTNEKPYRCNYCDFKTAQPSSLSRHNKRAHLCQLIERT